MLRGVLDAAPRPVAGSTGPALRGVLLAVVLVAVFGSLFASADGAFAQLVDELAPRQSLVDWLPERFAVGLLVVALAGGLALVARGGGDRAASGSPTSRSTLGPTEWGIALGALVALFAAFVAVQFVVLFGGERHVLETAGLDVRRLCAPGLRPAAGSRGLGDRGRRRRLALVAGRDTRAEVVAADPALSSAP